MKVIYKPKRNKDTSVIAGQDVGVKEEMEYWKPIVGFESRYAISTYGRVKRLARWKNGRWGEFYINEMILSLETDKDGYKIANFNIDGKIYKRKVHRLVAQHFIDNVENKPEVNHIDSDRSNNRLRNLEWATTKENAIHGIKYGNKKVIKIPAMPGASNPRALKLGQYDMNGNLIASFNCMKEIESKLGLCVAMIRKVAKGYMPAYKGFIWKYL